MNDDGALHFMGPTDDSAIVTEMESRRKDRAKYFPNHWRPLLLFLLVLLLFRPAKFNPITTVVVEAAQAQHWPLITFLKRS